jgi:O-antigen/teichoic acid export membrane protein
MDKTFLRHAAIYGLGTLLIHAGSLVLLPIYLDCLELAEYGFLEVVNRLAETVGTCLLFGGFRQALFTFYKQAPSETERRRVVMGTFFLVAAAGCVGVVSLLLFGSSLESFLFMGVKGIERPRLLLTLAVVSIIIEPFTLMPLALIQARVESAVYVVVVVAQFLFRIGLCIFLVRFLHWGPVGALTATTVSGVVFGLALSFRELGRGIAWPSRKQLEEMLHFALPLLPGGLCYMILHNGDRYFFLRHGISLDEVATYSLGYKLAMTVKIFSVMPLYMVWSSQMYAVAKQPDAGVVFGRMTTRILSAVLFVGLGMSLFAREVISLLGGPNYGPAVDIVAPILVVCLLQSAVMMMDAGFYLRHQTGQKMGVTIASTVVILVLYEWLIPLMGGEGAALATIGGFGFLLLATLVTSQRLFSIRYEWGRLALLIGLTVGLWLAGRDLPPSWWAIATKVGLLASVPVIVWWTGLLRQSEKQQIRELVGRAITLIQRTPALTPAEPDITITLDQSKKIAIGNGDFAQGGA